MSLGFFGKKAKLGMELGIVILLNCNGISKKFPISQISHFFTINPIFRNFFGGTYTNYSLYINYFKYMTHAVSIFRFRFDIFFVGNLGNWETCTQHSSNQRVIYSLSYSQFCFIPNSRKAATANKREGGGWSVFRKTVCMCLLTSKLGKLGKVGKHFQLGWEAHEPRNFKTKGRS